MSNDELVEIDALIARKQPLPQHLAEILREQLATNAARAVVREKRIADLERRVGDGQG